MPVRIDRETKKKLMQSKSTPNMLCSSLQISFFSFPFPSSLPSSFLHLFHSLSLSLSRYLILGTMELVQELLFTASLALLFSFLVAKLVSLAMAADLKTAQNVDDRILANEVRFMESETRVGSVDGGSGLNLVEETCEIVRGGEVPVLGEEVSEIVELLENSPQEGSGSGQENLETRDVDVVEEREEKGVESEGDDWEGVERSELERVFAAAANFVGSGNKGDGWSNDVQMKLYGLHKIAVEGPCHEPQPMPLKLSARAKWYYTFLYTLSSCFGCSLSCLTLDQLPELIQFELFNSTLRVNLRNQPKLLMLGMNYGKSVIMI